MQSVEELTVPRRVARALRENGIRNLDELCALNERELLAIPSVGRVAVAGVRLALEALGRALAVDEYAPYVCARHGAPAWDANLANLFLCDACTDLWKREAFSDEGPVYTGAPLHGYCLNCNLARDDVRLRQWFLCGTCERVARSIGRSVVAERFLMDRWAESITHHAPHLALSSVDVPTLRRRSSDASATKKAAIDFHVTDTRAARDLFGIELKTGKSYISGRAQVGTRMSEFQLDTTDCDDIMAVMHKDRIPVYLFHVQVIDRASPPTVEYRAVGAWWTDPFQMLPSQRRIQRRPRETRDAVYFERAMFNEFDGFTEHVRTGGHLRMVERFQCDGAPSLYRR